MADFDGTTTPKSTDPPSHARRRLTKSSDTHKPGAQEVEKIIFLILTRREKAQQDKVITKAVFRGCSIDYITKRSKRLDGMFRIIVIPRHVIKIQKCEHGITIFLQSIDGFSRDVAKTKFSAEMPVEAIDQDLCAYPESAFVNHAGPPCL